MAPLDNALNTAPIDLLAIPNTIYCAHFAGHMSLKVANGTKHIKTIVKCVTFPLIMAKYHRR